jgi:bifunctional N-acetylglucosamine-1-phosphate-uridyltransferase/glucosamine-1-phosphate-acetyltransferase GlmU-like protein
MNHAELNSAERTPELRPEDWTIVIPAAGKGSRLAFDKPKILYPVEGATILERLVGSLQHLAGKFVFVLSETGKTEIAPYLEALLPNRYTIALQQSPKGMADAVWAARDQVDTPSTVVVWGDQIGIREQTVHSCMRLHAARKGAACTFPTYLREKPYIHYQCDSSGKLDRVLQAREGDTLPVEGETDCGVFCFSTPILFSSLLRAGAMPRMFGAVTGEWNLLPLLELLDEGPDWLTAVRVQDESETLGVNSVADVRQLEHYRNVARTNS